MKIQVLLETQVVVISLQKKPPQPLNLNKTPPYARCEVMRNEYKVVLFWIWFAYIESNTSSVLELDYPPALSTFTNPKGIYLNS